VLIIAVFTVILCTAFFQLHSEQIIYKNLTTDLNQNHELVDQINFLRKQKELKLLSFQITRDAKLLTEIELLTRRTDQALDTINVEKFTSQENKLLQAFVGHRIELQDIERIYTEAIIANDKVLADKVLLTWEIKNQVMTAVLTDLNNLNSITIIDKAQQAESTRGFLKVLLAAGVILLIILGKFAINYYLELLAPKIN
jgi:hypothetical protein